MSGEFSILFEVETGDETDPAILSKRASLPFLPRKGDWVSPAEDDDLREVNALYWTPEAGFAVWFENETQPRSVVEGMKRNGWAEAES